MNWGNTTGNNLMVVTNSDDIIIGGTIIQDSINFDGTIINGYPIVGGFLDAFIAKFNNSSLSLNDNNSMAIIDVFPNPTSGELYFSGDIENIKGIELYDYTGKKIKSANNNNINQIDISHLPIGLYLVKIIDNYNNISTKKIIKK